MSTLTIERLIELMTKKDADIWPNKISRSAYLMCRERIIKCRDNVISLIRTNYWPQLEQHVVAIGRTINSSKLFMRIKTAGTLEDNQLYNYLIELYVLNNYLKTLDESVESRIEYCEHTY